MPVTYSRIDKKIGVEKSRPSLSLHSSNVLTRGTKNNNIKQDPFDLLRQSEAPRVDLKSENFSFELSPIKRPLIDTYSKTLNASKKLKLIQDDSKENSPPASEAPGIRAAARGSRATAMLNGLHNPEDVSVGGGQRRAAVASLANLGNTCFLNSVLYTLRLAPRFLHNLHHLVADLAAADGRPGAARLKSASLGRSAAGLAALGSRSCSTKDLLSLAHSDPQPCKSKFQVVTERLHETYANLKAAETRCSPNNIEGTTEPFAADAFFAALRDLNTTFEGNRQQDAHELWVCVIDSIRETCGELKKRVQHLQRQETEVFNSPKQAAENDGSTALICSKASLGNLRKSWKKRKKEKKAKGESPTKNGPRLIEEEAENGASAEGENGEGDGEAEGPGAEAEAEARSRPGWDFITEEFEGTTVLRTTCAECETVTETKQAMCDISVPIAEEGEGAERALPAGCVSSERLRDQNKYWCGRCLRYNEAERSVAYEALPRLLVLNLKRFSDGMEKITRHAATPLAFRCFCEACAARPDAAHRYALWAVIMHLGQTLSGGHYVAYTRYATRQEGSEEARCPREERAPPAGAERPGLMRSLFARRPLPAAGCCGAADCCALRRRDAPPHSDSWLMCDDEVVKPISCEDFEDLLSAEPEMRSAATPYLLFYVRSEDV